MVCQKPFKFWSGSKYFFLHSLFILVPFRFQWLMLVRIDGRIMLNKRWTWIQNVINDIRIEKKRRKRVDTWTSTNHSIPFNSIELTPLQAFNNYTFWCCSGCVTWINRINKLWRFDMEISAFSWQGTNNCNLAFIIWIDMFQPVHFIDAANEYMTAQA